VTLNGGALEAANNVTLNDGNIGLFLGANASLTVDTNATFSIANPISSVSGSVALTKTGPGKLILSGNNPFNGTLNVDSGQTATGNDGMLVIANNTAIQNIIAFPGLPFITIRNENAATSTLGLDGTLGSITVSPDFTLNGRNNTVPAIENLVGNNTISGGFSLGVGGGTYAFQSDSGVLTLSANLPEATPTSSGRTVTFQGAGNVTVTGQIVDGSNNGASNVWDNVVVAGPGILSLPVANTYSGFTGVSNGVLSLTGSLNSLAGVTVSGGLLVGNGSITGPVTNLGVGAIEAGATNAIGTLTFASSLTLGGNTIVKISKTGSLSDKFVGQTAITYGGTLTVTNLAGTLALGDSFTLFNPGASTSNFSHIAGSAGAGLGFSFTNGLLTVVTGPATNPTNILASVSGNQLTLSWPADHQGWTLQAQTNSLTSGLGTNWVDVPGSSGVTQEVFTLSPGNSSVFYRMRL
jgi:autotransporter-associated beta strand protein